MEGDPKNGRPEIIHTRPHTFEVEMTAISSRFKYRFVFGVGNSIMYYILWSSANSATVTSSMRLAMTREFLKANFLRVFNIEAEGRRPVSHAIAAMWILLLLVILLGARFFVVPIIGAN